MKENHAAWLSASLDAIASYRRMIDASIAQLSDDELTAVPAKGINSVAVNLRHLGGNLQSRWTDFLTSDGEKPDRDRDSEFESWPGTRASLMAHLDAGWLALTSTMSSLSDDDLERTVMIRGEPHTVPQAILRALTHIAYHVGQIMVVARAVHRGDWKWLTIPPGGSRIHNQTTWGTSRSRGVAGVGEDPE